MSAQAPETVSHLLPIGSRINERGRLEVGGCDLVELAATYGTPAYIVAEDDLRARARAFLGGLHELHADSDVLFASKAFPCTAVMRVLAGEGLACDVASGGELTLALRAGFDPARIYLHGNAKSRAELELAVAARVGHVVIDSAAEVEPLDQVAAAAGIVQEVLLRVTPDVSGDTHAAVSTGQANSKFGVGLGEAPAVIELIDGSSHLRLVGLHCHIGSQLTSLEPFRRAIEALAALGDFAVYNIGGGLGVPYTDAVEVPAIADYLRAVVEAARAHFGEAPRLLIEPGRALVASSTVTLYTVQTVKRNVSTWVAVDGGMSDNLRPMLYGSRYAALIADRPGRRDGELCQLAGKHCESGDVIIRDVRLPEPAPGDVVVTPVTGAYGHAMANNYNGVPRPPVVLVRDGQARVVIRRETYEDLFARDV